MTDLVRILPQFPVGQYASLIPALERNALTTSDLLTLDAADIGKRTHLPLLDVRRLCGAVLAALHADLGPRVTQPSGRALKHTPASLSAQWQTISTLDAALDHALGGGIPAGYVTEITGESGAGKTQFLLTLLLAVQLPPPHGIGRPAMHISTEAALSTKRLSQMLIANPLFRSMDAASRPSLDQIFSTVTPDLESQDHILSFQVPVEVERRNIGLLVLDSVATNYRAEFERSARGQASNMGARSTELVRLGMQLRELAQKHNLAVVVSNQVADRFSIGGPGGGGGFKTPAFSSASSFGQSTIPVAVGGGGGGRSTQESPLATRSKPVSFAKLPDLLPSSSLVDAPSSSAFDEDRLASMRPPPPPFPGDEDIGPPAPPALLLDHQQRWFTGWGDDRYADYGLKTPSLGLVWSTQIASRIALLKRPAYGQSRHSLDDEDDGRGVPTLRHWRRWMKVVFAPHAAPSGPGVADAVEFEVTMGGIKAVDTKREDQDDNVDDQDRR
ncbi:DNA repair protein RAD57 [Apodospora peruviana]|uniref:DNA repair protein RAD57 n=1 Tax=Apodospora peruviana TaxID=516989 RepID=A0AAE0HZY5_9PEZI|nr:DNA repair protein RAD57 [Apodospora peruviana]